ncbi:MAG: 30S ribosomal protein S27ae [Candidatus Woesearchaeota archaeon]
MAEKKSSASKKKTSHRLSRFYTVAGGSLQKKAKFCPKCGVGFYMAQHKNRLTCGNCKYTEMLG